MKKMFTVILLILLFIVVFLVFNQLFSKGCSQSNSALRQKPATLSQETSLKTEVVRDTLTATEKSPTEEIAQKITKSRVFWGNRGYITRDGRTTYVTSSVLLLLRKEWEAGCSSGEN